MTRYGNRLAGSRLQNAVRRQHEFIGFHLRFFRKRQMHGHLVAVKISIKGVGRHRGNLNCLAFDENRPKRLHGETVQRRRTIKQNEFILDGFFKRGPYVGYLLFDQTACRFNVMRQTLANQDADHERLEQFQRHVLRQTAHAQR